MFIGHVKQTPTCGVIFSCEAITEMHEGFILEDVYFVTAGVVTFNDAVKRKGQFSLVDVFNLKAKRIRAIWAGNIVGEACCNEPTFSSTLPLWRLSSPTS
jgi:hypothetical protein